MVANSSRISGGSSSNDNNNNNQNIQTPKSTNNSESVDSRKTVDVFVCTKCEIYLSSSEHFAYSIEFLHALGFRGTMKNQWPSFGAGFDITQIV
ncbi:MAG: hypothetical protein MHMPM18_003492 [Marteilia pararefringens]